MSDVLARIRFLVGRGDIAASVHGFRELAADGILSDEVIGGIGSAVVVEEYPEAFKGPSVLVLQRDREGKPLHILWGNSERRRWSGDDNHCVPAEAEPMVE